MSYPVIEDITPTTTPTDTQTHVIDYPATVDPGDLLILIFVCDDNETVTCSAFTEIYNEDSGPQGPTLYVGWRDAVGDEDGTTFTVTTGSNESSCAYVFRISGAADPSTSPPEASIEGTGSSTNPNSLSLTPTGGSKDYLWISGAGNDDDDDVTGYPSNMADNNQYIQTTSVTLGIATEEATAASFDPAAFTIAATESWQAVTIAVHPPPPDVTTYDRSVLLDTVLQKPDISRTVDIDTLLQKAGIPRTIDLDTLLKKEDVPKSVLLDTILAMVYNRSMDLDILLKALGVPKSIDLDTVLRKENLSRTVLLDTLLKFVVEKSVLLDALLKAEGVGRTVDLDTLLKKEGIPRTVLLDVVTALRTELSVLLDVLLKATGISRTVDLDTILREEGISRSVLLDVYLKAVTTYQRTVLLDTLLKGLGIPTSVDLDTVLQKADVPRSVLIDALLILRTQKTVLVDTLLKREGISRTVLIDVRISTGVVIPPTDITRGRRRRFPREPKPILEEMRWLLMLHIGNEASRTWPVEVIIAAEELLAWALEQVVGNEAIFTADLEQLIGNEYTFNAGAIEAISMNEVSYTLHARVKSITETLKGIDLNALETTTNNLVKVEKLRRLKEELIGEPQT